MEAREDLAANGADLERQTQLAARHSADLTMARRKLHDSTATLAEARSAVAVLRGGAEHGAAALQREQREVAALQAALGAARQEASRAKHLRDAQVRSRSRAVPPASAALALRWARANQAGRHAAVKQWCRWPAATVARPAAALHRLLNRSHVCAVPCPCGPGRPCAPLAWRAFLQQAGTGCEVVQATASKDKLQEHEVAAAQRQRALEQQLAARDTAAATLRSELKAATEAAAERAQAQHAQQRTAQLQAQELADAKLRARVGLRCMH